MQFAATAANETPEDLAARVYDFGAAAPPAAVRAAAKALTDANPFLRKPDEVPAGTLVAVPPLENATPSAETQPGEPVITSILAGQLRGAVSLAQRLLSEEIATAIADAQQAGDAVRSRSVKAAARDDPLLAQTLPQLGETAAARIEAAQELERYQKQAFAQLDRDLEELVATFGSSAPASSG